MCEVGGKRAFMLLWENGGEFTSMIVMLVFINPLLYGNNLFNFSFHHFLISLESTTHYHYYSCKFSLCRVIPLDINYHYHYKTIPYTKILIWKDNYRFKWKIYGCR